MRTSVVLRMRPVLLTVGAGLAATLVWTEAHQVQGDPVAVDNDDIGGVVSGPNGPEAGVCGHRRNDRPAHQVSSESWSPTIGDATSCPIFRMRNYNVWVRGYGLVDSPKVQASPGRTLNLTAVVAPDERAAAQYYPAGYWFFSDSGAGSARVPGHGP